MFSSHITLTISVNILMPFGILGSIELWAFIYVCVGDARRDCHGNPRGRLLSAVGLQRKRVRSAAEHLRGVLLITRRLHGVAGGSVIFVQT